MDCPHCHQKLPAATCPACEEEIPEESKFCLHCGTLVEVPQADPDDPMANRILCSDETCIGVIGPDGKCKECGQPYRPGAGN